MLELWKVIDKERNRIGRANAADAFRNQFLTVQVNENL